MGKTDQDKTGWRGSRELWLEAARQAFVERGIDAVRIQPLARGLGLSRTSFYWFFADRQALLDALLELWETQTTGVLLAACEAYAETLPEAVLNLLTPFLDEALFPPRFDFAMRGWAHGDDRIAARVRSADDTRLAAICEMFERFGVPAATADVRARTVYLAQMGYISLGVSETTDIRLSRVPDYVAIYAGVCAEPHHIARFEAHFR
ncbi:TetR/AcrR family transcriptional regulator [Citreicella sp. C3M06]|uniref:TetR/AcrR family transcriptional regulator n=1 Tax=Citreicella sp. C3M06 TaxID=2841564 RepID=UPI001C085E4E|nr:TetR/AcrR family transcriptional regulator [Citreicella sp. C3M06]MBU2961152.1 TetR/AcrR family transcriptional regulator [Citreicella sp. C3M06]